MGNFYTSFTVRSADHKAIVGSMKGRRAAVSPTVNRYTVIWDAECENQDQQLIDRVGQRLASVLASPVIAVLNHDDDILWYGLYSPTGKIDEYDSAPGYFAEMMLRRAVETHSFSSTQSLLSQLSNLLIEFFAIRSTYLPTKGI